MLSQITSSLWHVTMQAINVASSDDNNNNNNDYFGDLAILTLQIYYHWAVAYYFHNFVS